MSGTEAPGDGWFGPWEPRPDPSGEPEWTMEPLAAALAASAHRKETGDYPKPFCVEAGRRLLLAQLQMSSWILRRVEKVDLSAEQAVQRRITVELIVPRDAPVFVTPDNRRLRCVPLSVMRRRTLIGLHIWDEQERPVSLPGLRMTQALDQSLLLAAAACRLGSTSGEGVPDSLYRWITQAVSGTLPEVREAYADLKDGGPDLPSSVRNDPLFKATADQLRYNFTLYLFLDEAVGRHRVLHLSFEEPTDWRYQRPELQPVASEGGTVEEWEYLPGTPRATWRDGLARFGLRSTRMRFQVPGAESAASFHFELSSPPGVQIVQAILIAGRPNEPPPRRPSFDLVRGHTPTVGLHAVEVPNGSLCRVQADLCVTARGWLSTMAVATLVIAALMVTTMLHAEHRSRLSDLDATNAILFLVTTVAAAAALVAQRDHTGVAARFVAGVRALVTLALGLPVVTAGFLGFRGSSRLTSDATAYRFIIVLTVLSVLIFALTAAAWAVSWLNERRRVVEESPWDMSRPEPKEPRHEGPRRQERFDDVVRRFKFNRPAVGVASAEGWHTVYGWDDDHQAQAVAALSAAPWLRPRDPVPGWLAFATIWGDRFRQGAPARPDAVRPR